MFKMFCVFLSPKKQRISRPSSAPIRAGGDTRQRSSPSPPLTTHRRTLSNRSRPRSASAGVTVDSNILSIVTEIFSTGLVVLARNIQIASFSMFLKRYSRNLSHFLKLTKKLAEKKKTFVQKCSLKESSEALGNRSDFGAYYDR